MSDQFFEKPILNSPYNYPARHWELDPSGQPTQNIIQNRRRAEFITPIPKPKKRKSSNQDALIFDEGKGLSTAEQQYQHTDIIQALRHEVDRWRELPNPNDWKVTPETARLLQHWRHHPFAGVRPFFCQIEAVETAIWLTEVAPQLRAGERFIQHLKAASAETSAISPSSPLPISICESAFPTGAARWIFGLLRLSNATARPRTEPCTTWC